MADNKKPFDKSLNSAEDWTTREVFNNLSAEDQRLFTFNMLEDYESRLFELQQKVENFEEETDIKMTDAEYYSVKMFGVKKKFVIISAYPLKHLSVGVPLVRYGL